MDQVFSLSEIDAVAALLWQQTGKGSVLAFHGSMGAGKTTFIHALCRYLGVTDKVSSPTFSLINEYHSPAGVLYHMDLYRLNSEEEALRAGVEEALYSGSTCLVEWPEKAPALFPPDTVHVYLELAGDHKRRLHIRRN
jgi:tRNA threonylcarbamoyladenosine biosynthesis protein TsaE